MTDVTVADGHGRAANTGMWLFLASLVMFYGALFSGYVLLRTGSATWEMPWRPAAGSDWTLTVDHWFRTMWLAFAVMQSRRLSGSGVAVAGLPRFSWLMAFAGTAFVWRCIDAGGWLASQGLVPASSVALACWYALNGAVAALVAGGTVAAVWVALEPVPPLQRARRGAMLQRYWLLMLALWVVTVVGLYLV